MKLFLNIAKRLKRQSLKVNRENKQGALEIQTVVGNCFLKLPL